MTRLGNSISRCLDKTVAAAAVRGPGRLGDERIATCDPRAKSCESARHLPLAAAYIDDTQAPDRPDRRQHCIGMRHSAEITNGRPSHASSDLLLLGHAYQQ